MSDNLLFLQAVQEVAWKKYVSTIMESRSKDAAAKQGFDEAEKAFRDALKSRERSDDDAG